MRRHLVEPRFPMPKAGFLPHPSLDLLKLAVVFGAGLWLNASSPALAVTAQAISSPFGHGAEAVALGQVELGVAALDREELAVRQPDLGRSPLPPANLLAQLNFTVRRVRPSRHRVGGIARGGSACSPDRQSPLTLVPLVPPSDPQLASAGSIAIEPVVAAQPVVLVYVPRNLAQRAEFLLTAEGETPMQASVLVYEAQFTPPSSPGVIAIVLPQLEVNRLYGWSLQLGCDPTGDRSGDALVAGWIQRLNDATVVTQTAQMAERDRPALFAEAGYWQDTISTLAALRSRLPTDPTLLADWVSLLKSVNLGNIAQAPLIQLALENSLPTPGVNPAPAASPSSGTGPTANPTPAVTPGSRRPLPRYRRRTPTSSMTVP